MKPKRVQLKRTKGWRMPPNTKKVDRSTRWGNPFIKGSYVILKDFPPAIVEATGFDLRTSGIVLSSPQVFFMFRAWLQSPEQAELLEQAKAELTGYNPACWCDEDYPWCHADVWLELLNGE